jgi:hypothetical protein
MAFVYGDRVKESSSTIGTGSFVLEGAPSGFQTFADGIGEGNETYYVIINDSAGTWEIGVGTYMGGALSRDTVLASTNAGSLVNFGSGTKTVGATVSKDFYENALAEATHPSIDHQGILGVPDPETFTSTDHEGVDHTGVPLGLLKPMDHASIDHTLPPLLLQTFLTHTGLDHEGIAGVNNFDEALHLVTDHSSVLGVPAPEVFDAAAHSVTDHTGLPGVGGVPAVDNQIDIVHQFALNNSLVLNLPAGGTWTVIAYGAYRNNGLNNLTTELRINSVVVSEWDDDDDPGGWCWYKHLGFAEGLMGGSAVNVDFDISDNFTNPDKTPVCFAIGLRTSS